MAAGVYPSCHSDLGESPCTRVSKARVRQVNANFHKESLWGLEAGSHSYFQEGLTWNVALVISLGDRPPQETLEPIGAWLSLAESHSLNTALPVVPCWARSRVTSE